VSLVVFHSESHVTGSLTDILGLFNTIYHYSARYDNQRGRHVAYSYLTGDDFERVWTHKLQNSYDDPEAVSNLKSILSTVLYALAKTISSTLEFRNVSDLKTLLNRLNPDEFLSGFDMAVQSIRELQLDVEWQLRQGQPESDPTLLEQYETLLEALNTKQEMGDYFERLTFVVTSFVFESYQIGEIDQAQAIKYREVLRSYLLPFDRLVKMFTQLVESGRSYWTFFYRHPDTKRVFSPDDEAKFYLLYCLRGIELVALDQIPKTLPVEDIQFRLERIEQVCTELVAKSDRWIPLIGGVSDFAEHSKKFVDINRRIAEEWGLRKEERIIASALDPAKTATFQSAFDTHRNSQPSLRRLLEVHERVTIGREIPSRRLFEVNRLAPKEYFTELYDDLNYARELAQLCSQAILDAENKVIVSGWLNKARTVPSRKKWQSIQPYADRAFAKLREDGFEPGLIIVPTSIRYEFFRRAASYADAHAVSVEPSLPHLQGTYAGIPVLTWYEEKEFMLVIDVTEVSMLEIEYVDREIRPVTDKIVSDMIEKNPTQDEQKLKLSVWVVAREKAQLRILGKKAIVKLRIKLSESMWLRSQSTKR
jgi:hypothetical protein